MVVALALLLSSRWFWRQIYPIPYRDLILQAATEASTDPYLIAAVVRVESSFQETGISQKGAHGLMQLMPETAQWVADKAGLPPPTPERLSTPSYNLKLGSWYLRYLIDRYHGRIAVALAAYNAGPNVVDRWLAHKTWDGTREHVSQIPYAETEHFVSRVYFFWDRYSWLYGMP